MFLRFLYLIFAFHSLSSIFFIIFSFVIQFSSNFILLFPLITRTFFFLSFSGSYFLTFSHIPAYFFTLVSSYSSFTLILCLTASFSYSFLCTSPPLYLWPVLLYLKFPYPFSIIFWLVASFPYPPSFISSPFLAFFYFYYRFILTSIIHSFFSQSWFMVYVKKNYNFSHFFTFALKDRDSGAGLVNNLLAYLFIYLSAYAHFFYVHPIAPVDYSWDMIGHPSPLVAQAVSF